MKLTRVITALVLSILVVASISPSIGTCFGCTAAQKFACAEEADTKWHQCMMVYGPGQSDYCDEESSKVYANCLLVKGCPVPIRNQ